MRVNTFTIAIGRRGSGKTFFALNVIKKLYGTKYPKIFIFDTFDHESYQAYKIIQPQYIPAVKAGIVRIMVDDESIESVLEIIKLHVRNALLIFEDAGKYIEERIGTQFKNVILDTKQKNVDILAQFHCIGDVPPRMFKYSDYITLFKQADHPKNHKKTPNLTLFIQAYNAVQAHPNKYHNITFQIT